MTATAGPRPAGRARRGPWVLLLLLAAALTGAVAAPTWVVGEGRSALDGAVTVGTSGTRAAPQAGAAALVLLAAAGAVALVGRAGRVVVAVVTGGAGVLLGAAAVGVLVDPAGAAAPGVADATGVAAGTLSASPTAAPVAGVVLGLVVVLLAVALARAGGSWEQRSRRHERPATDVTHATPSDEADERADWDALSRGDDPS